MGITQYFGLRKEDHFRCPIYKRMVNSYTKKNICIIPLISKLAKANFLRNYLFGKFAHRVYADDLVEIYRLPNNPNYRIPDILNCILDIRSKLFGKFAPRMYTDDLSRDLPVT